MLTSLPLNRIFLPVALLSLIALLSACGGTTPVVGAQPQAIVEHRDGYRFLSRDELRRLNPLANDLTNNRIELSIEKAFAQRGLLYQEGVTEHGIVVSYFVVGNDKQAVADYNRAIRPCSACPLSGVQKKVVFQYERGTLIIDVLSAKTRRSLWRGTIEKMLEAEQSPTERNESIKASVSAVLAQFPPAS